MYETFYKLNCRPFRVSVTEGCYYESSRHRKTMSYLRYGVEAEDGIIVVTGHIGAGKTTLVKRLISTLDRNKISIVEIVTTQLSPFEILQLITHKLGLPVQGITSKVDLLIMIEDYINSRVWDDERVYIIVDEAQNLPRETLEELRMLTNLNVAGVSTLQMFLVGQPSLKNVLANRNMEQFRQRVVSACHLGPLEGDEVEEYIKYRLRFSGWSGDPALESGIFSVIAQLTAGIPRRINLLCDRVMMIAFANFRHSLDEDLVREAYAELQKDHLYITHPRPKNASVTEPV